MSTTEEDASTKWCPMVRVQLYSPREEDNPPLNRSGSNTNCIASKCMMWRWDKTRKFGDCGLKGGAS